MASTCVTRKTVAIIGGGIAGMTTAARLQAMGVQTVVLESYKVVGGCAGYYQNSGFSFDVGATTFVDFDEEGLGGQMLKSVGVPPIKGQVLPGYTAWLPDRTVHLYRDQDKWREERLAKLGNTEAHKEFWGLMDQISLGFWDATRKGIRMPMRNVNDLWHNTKVVSPRYWHLARYLNWTTGDALKHFGLYNDAPLKGLLGCLIEDTVNSTIENSPLINAALGVSIRGAGLTRFEGGAFGFWKAFERHYRSIDGELLLGYTARKVTGKEGEFLIHTNKGEIHAKQVVYAIPPPIAAKMNHELEQKLNPYFRRPDNQNFGGGIVVFLGVPEIEVEGQMLLHHQLLQDYSKPQGNGNNMFISVSPQGDTESAPKGYRAVVISTHCELEPWKKQHFIDGQDYYEKKKEMGDHLINLARRVYPQLATNPVVYEIGTPRTYQKFTKRPFGEVGGVKQTLNNSNQYAIPYSIKPQLIFDSHEAVGVPGMYLVGDGVWPGLGTVACVLGSRIVANAILEQQAKQKNTTFKYSRCPIAAMLQP